MLDPANNFELFFHHSVLHMRKLVPPAVALVALANESLEAELDAGKESDRKPLEHLFSVSCCIDLVATLVLT